MVLVKLGSGVTLYGYYMFHGGTNPDGKRTTLQESQATGYPNDLPVKSYDYQAPFGEFGQMNPSLRDLKTFHLFLDDFGSSLATMTAYFPDRMPASKSDTATPRVAARFRGRSWFRVHQQLPEELSATRAKEFPGSFENSRGRNEGAAASDGNPQRCLCPCGP